MKRIIFEEDDGSIIYLEEQEARDWNLHRHYFESYSNLNNPQHPIINVIWRKASSINDLIEIGVSFSGSVWIDNTVKKEKQRYAVSGDPKKIKEIEGIRYDPYLRPYVERESCPNDEDGITFKKYKLIP